MLSYLADVIMAPMGLSAGASTSIFGLSLL